MNRRWGTAGVLVAALVIGGCSSRNRVVPRPDSGPIASDGSAGTDADPDVRDARDAGADGLDTTAEVADASDSSPDVVAPHGDGGFDVLPPRPDADPRPLWTDASSAVDISCAGYHEGTMRFRAGRDQLSAGELAMLANLRLATGPFNPCVPDLFQCTIAVTQGDGGVASYVTVALDQICGAPDNLISYASFQPLLAALPCRYGHEGGAFASPPPPPLLPDERCFNGVALPTVVPDVVLAVSQAGVTHHVEVTCSSPPAPGSIALQVFAAGATTPLVEGTDVTTPGPDHICVRLDHAFEAAGDYRLHIGSGADAGSFLGFARYYRFY